MRLSAHHSSFRVHRLRSWRVGPVDFDAVRKLLGDLVRNLLAEENRAQLAAGDDLHRARVDDREGEAACESFARDLYHEVCVLPAARDDHAPRLKLFALAQRVLYLVRVDE